MWAVVYGHRLENIWRFASLQMRQFQTSATRQDIDQAAKYIGAGAATVGVAGSGSCLNRLSLVQMQ